MMRLDVYFSFWVVSLRLHHGFSGYRSLEGQINGFPTMPQPESGKEYKWEILKEENGYIYTICS
jgi:hypothetical protein